MAPLNVKTVKRKSFQEKWIAISSKGTSKPYFRESSNAIRFIYLEGCVQKRIISFIEEHHHSDKVVFWPDLASSHYAKSVMDYLKAATIEIVTKNENLPNLPEGRPIENFWSILKGLVYKNNLKAKTLQQLKERIKYCLT